MMQTEKSGDYGSAIRGDEMTAAFNAPENRSPFTGGYETLQRWRNGEDNTVSRVAVTLGAIVMVALVFLCFRLAYDGVRQSSAAKTLSGQRLIDDAARDPDTYRGAGAPNGGKSDVPGLTVARPAAIVMPPSVSGPPPMVMLPDQTSRRLFQTVEGKADALALLSDCRAAYAQSGVLANKWFAAVGNAHVAPDGGLGTDTPERELTSTDPANNNATAIISRPLTADEWRTIDVQIDALTSTVAFATRTTAYPDALQGTSAGYGREMRVYLQTERTALAATDPERRGALRGRAETHRQKAGELLTRLESAVRSDTAPPNDPNLD